MWCVAFADVGDSVDDVTMSDAASDFVDDDVATNDIAHDATDATVSSLHCSIDDDDFDKNDDYISDTLIVSEVPDAVFERQHVQVNAYLVPASIVSHSVLYRLLYHV